MTTPRNTRNNNNPVLSANIFDNSITRWSTIIAISFALFGAGFAVGAYKTEFDNKLEKLNQTMDCNKAVQAEKERFEDYKRSIEQKEKDNLIHMVEELKKGGVSGR